MLRKNKKQWIKKPTKKKNHSNFLHYNQSLFINTKKSPTMWAIFFIDICPFSAEKVGFEPTIQFPVYKLSRLARSTTLTSLRLILEAKVRIKNLILNYLNVLRSFNNKKLFFYYF